MQAAGRRAAPHSEMAGNEFASPAALVERLGRVATRTPVAWLHYFGLLIFVFGQRLIAARRGAVSGRALVAAFLGCWIIQVVQPLVISLITHHGADPRALLTTYHAGFGAMFTMLPAEQSCLSLLIVFVAAYWLVSDAAVPAARLAVA